MNKYYKYPSIENHTLDSVVEFIRNGGYATAKIIWYAMEKIHGSNFSMTCNGRDIKPGKRTGYVGPKENFLSCHISVDKYSNAVRKLSEYLIRTHGCAYVQIFGELFGGSYEHPDVPAVPKAIRIQKGVNYSPNQEFMVFDILLHQNSGEPTYLNCSEMLDVCGQFGLPVIEPIKVGTFDELLNLPLPFTSTIHEYFNLPEIPNNWAEGYVIKPDKTMFSPKGQRIALKMKDKLFGEVKPRDPEAQTQASQKGKGKENSTKPTSEVDSGIAELKRYITENRFDGLISKVGDEKSTGELIGLYTKDMITDYKKEHSHTPQVMKQINRGITRDVSEAVRQWKAKMDYSMGENRENELERLRKAKGSQTEEVDE